MSPDQATFDFEVPSELVAQDPLSNRVDARLMLVDRQRDAIDHYHIRDLPELIGPTDHLVLNDTRVVPARLVGRRTLTGGRWQGLFLGIESDAHEDSATDPEHSPTGHVTWRILQKTRGKLQPGETITLSDLDNRDAIRLTLIARRSDGEWLARPVTEVETYTLLGRIGRVPLPPYIRGGNMVDADRSRYQTVFARHPGAVAAPTAGLHFTTELLRELERSGTEFSAVTLHVGLDTFRPIATDDLGAHQMHREWAELSPAAAERINHTRATGGRIVAVGTTSVRVLETAAATGDDATSTQLRPYRGETDLFIRPPYRFRCVDALLTNFHFPRTTLLVLVCTFAGRELMQRAYQEAIEERYRFFSYGDAMLIV